MAAQLVTCEREGVCFAAVPSIGENIARLRKHAGFVRQGAFATALGVPQGQLSDWEKGRYGMLDTETLIKIAKVLDCSIDRLLSGVDPIYDEAVSRDLIRHAVDQKSGQSSHVGDPLGDSAQARVLQLESENRDLRSALNEVTHVASQLVEIATVGAKGSAVTETKPGRSRRDRKTG